MSMSVPRDRARIGLAVLTPLELTDAIVQQDGREITAK